MKLKLVKSGDVYTQLVVEREDGSSFVYKDLTGYVDQVRAREYGFRIAKIFRAPLFEVES